MKTIGVVGMKSWDSIPWRVLRTRSLIAAAMSLMTIAWGIRYFFLQNPLSGAITFVGAAVFAGGSINLERLARKHKRRESETNHQ